MNDKQLKGYKNLAEFIKQMFYGVDPIFYDKLYSEFRRALSKKNSRQVYKILSKKDEYDETGLKKINELNINKVIHSLNATICEQDVDIAYVCYTLPMYSFISIEKTDYIYNHEEFLTNDGVIDPDKEVSPYLWKYRDMKPNNFLKTLHISDNSNKYLYVKSELNLTGCLAKTAIGRAFLQINSEIENKNFFFEDLKDIQFKTFANDFIVNKMDILSKEDKIFLWRLFTGGGKKYT